MLLSTLFFFFFFFFFALQLFVPTFFLTYYSTSLIIPLRFQDISLFLDVSSSRSKSFFYSFFWSALVSCLYRTVSGDPLDQVFIYLLGNPSNNNKQTNKQTITNPTGTFWPRLTTFDVHDQITIATRRQTSICPSCESPKTGVSVGGGGGGYSRKRKRSQTQAQKCTPYLGRTKRFFYCQLHQRFSRPHWPCWLLSAKGESVRKLVEVKNMKTWVGRRITRPKPNIGNAQRLFFEWKQNFLKRDQNTTTWKIGPVLAKRSGGTLQRFWGPSIANVYHVHLSLTFLRSIYRQRLSCPPVV